MAYYRATFPFSTVLPKMHIVEDHAVPWLKRWHVGSGLMGEQGAESIHAHLHKLDVQLCGIPNELQRLQYIVREYNLQSSPQLNDLQPPPRKREKLMD